MTRIVLIALATAAAVLVAMGSLMPGAPEGPPMVSFERATLEPQRSYVEKDGLHYLVAGATMRLVAKTGHEMQESFHEFRRLEDGRLIGRIGPLEFLVDPYDGKLESKGFHHISVAENGYRASLGATQFTLSSSGQVVSQDGEAEPESY